MKFTWKRSIRYLQWILRAGLFGLCFQATLVAADLSVGNKSGVYIDDGGAMFGWGANGSGQLGDDSKIDRLVPVFPAEIASWLKVATNLTGVADNTFEGHTLAIKAEGAGGTQGTLWAWGDNSLGQLGQGDTTERLVPTQVGSASNWVAVEVGSAFSMALNAAGEIWIWGDNRFKQLGSGVIADFLAVPTRLADKDGGAVNNDEWISIAAGADYALAVHSFSAGAPWGAIYGWGRNTVSQLGLGHNASPVAAPSKVPGSTLWKSVEAGTTSSFGIDSYFFLYAWGQGPFGGLGLGSSSGTSIVEVASPTKVVTSIPSIDRFKSVSAGTSHTLAVSTSGHFFGTGQNASGQLGLSGSNLYNVFQYVRADVDLASAGKASSAIVLTDGSLLTAGSNDRGQLGNGTTNSVGTFTGSALGGIDLSIDAIVMHTPVAGLSGGDSIEFSLTLHNYGTGDANIAGMNYAAALSPATTIDAVGAIALSGVSYAILPSITSITPGGTLVVRLTGSLPDPVVGGTYNLVAEVDSGDPDLIDETDEMNNTISADEEGAITFTLDLLPVVGSPSLATSQVSYDVGDSLTVNFEIQNDGTGALNKDSQGSFRLKFLLTPNFDDLSEGTAIELIPILGATELELVIDLAPGATYPGSLTFEIPEGVDAVSYYLAMIVDDTAVLNESNELNNTRISTTKLILIADLDLDEALDALGTVFTTTGPEAWYGLGLSGANDEDAAFSPLIVAGETAGLQTFLSQPSVIRFNWKSATASASNRLSFQVAGSSYLLELSGQTGWEEITLPVSSNVTLFWEYAEGVESATDRVYLDNLRVDAMTAPDFVLDSLSLLEKGQLVESVSLVAGQDSLGYGLQLRNQGVDHPSGTPFVLELYLSKDSNFDPAEDVKIRSLDYTGPLPTNQLVPIIETIGLPTNLSGDYYLIAVADANNAVDEIGVYDGSTPLPGLPVFPDGVGAAVQYNNIFVSETASVNVQALPDLTIKSSAPLESIEVFGYPDTIFTAGIDSFIAKFTVKNRGLGGAFGSMQISVVLSDDQNFDVASDYFLGQIPYFVGFPADGQASSEQLVSVYLPSIPSTVPVGEFRYVGVFVDSGGAFTETDESNNVVFTRNPAYAFGTVNIDSAAEYIVTAPTSYPFSAGFPFFGQTTESNDGVDALQSARIDDGDKSYFEASVTVAADSLLSFYWKVSSEDSGTNKRDALKLYSNGELRSSIAGEVDWTQQTLLLPASATPYTLRWSYEKDSSASAGDDMAWVDQISVAALNQPDLSFSSVQLVEEGSEVESASYVIGFDSLNLNFDVRNGGISYSGTPGIDVNFYLSEDALWDANDYPVDGVAGLVQTYNGALASDAQFSNSPSITIDTSIPEGEYYLIGVVDQLDTIVEFDETNNTFVSDARIVQLLALPDLIVEYTNQDFGGLFLVDDALALSMDITNQGYGVVEGTFDVQLLLSSDESIDVSDLLLREYSQTKNLTSPTGGENSYTFAPAIGAVGDQVPLAERLYLAAFVDAADVFEESDEVNNIEISTEPAFIFGQIGLAEAVDWDSTTEILANNETLPFAGDLPFVGLNEASTVSDDIARSTIITDGESSGFVLNVDLAEPAAISFLWKVSGERTVNEDQSVKEDTFTVYLDNTEYAVISGEVDWIEQIVALPAGTHEIRWVYEKDDSLSAGSDTAWIDSLRYLPDLDITELTVSNPDATPLSGLSPKEKLEIELVVENTALGDVPAGAEYPVEVRLSTDSEWGNSDDVVLALTPVTGTSNPIVGKPAKGDRLTLSFTSLVPEQTAALDYYILARVDPDTSNDAVNSEGALPEVNDENNDFSSASASITVAALSIVDALDIDPDGFDTSEYQIVFPTSFNVFKMVQTGDTSWIDSPDIEVDEHFKRWFAAAGVVGAVGEDAIKSPVLDAGSAASLLFRLDKPRVVSFRVKANTNSSRNYMFFGANGNALRPEGAVSTAFFSGSSDLESADGWQTVHYIVPAEAPVGFTYVQELAPVDDERVFVDELAVGVAITEPDYVIDSLQYDAGEYVLDRDRLFVVVKGSNRGLIESPLPEDFKIKVWLSTNATWSSDDMSLGYLEKFQELDQGTTFAYQASLILPQSLPETSYYLIARVDAENAVDEFAIDASTGDEVNEPSAFAEKDNNYLISPSRDIFIDRRADLRVLPPLDSPNDEIQVAGPAAHLDFPSNPDAIHDLLIIAPTGDEGQSEMLVRFDVKNEGLSGVSAAGDFVINVYAAETREEEPSPDRLITSFIETRGLAAASRTTYEITTDIPSHIEAGKFYYLNVVVDATDAISESDEEDNSTFSPYSNVFIGDVSLAVALNDEGIANAWDYSFVVPTEGDSTLQAAFFGTKSDYAQDNTASGIRASAQSGPVPVGGTSWMQTTFDVEDKRSISFRWKVSSQFEIIEGVVLEDILEFSIRGDSDTDFVQIAKISGEQDWAEFTYLIEQPGIYTLRWSYIENGDNFRAGADAAWVDDFSVAAFDFMPTFVPVSGSYAPGDTISLPVYIWNIQDRRIPDAGVTTQIRLSPNRGDVSNLDWSAANATDVEIAPASSKFSKLDSDDLIWLKSNLSSLEKGEVSDETLNQAMDDAIRGLLDAEAKEVEPELTETEIDALRTTLDDADKNWTDFTDDDLGQILGVGQSVKEQNSRKRFLPVRTYDDAPALAIPVGLSGNNSYYLGVWVNHLGVLIESNDSNNLLWTDGKGVALDAGQSIPFVLDQDSDSDQAVDDPDSLDQNDEWILSGDGRWFPIEDTTTGTIDGWSLSSPDPVTQTALPQDGSASVSALVEGPSLLRFQWRSEFAESSDTAQFLINGTPVSRESMGAGASTMQLSKADDGVWVSEQMLIPAGLQEITWSYSRVDDDQLQGRVYVDNVSFEVVDQADLAIIDVDYTGGAYALERDQFPLNVTVLNRGVAPSGFDYNDLDLEVRLALDDSFESASQVIGNLSVVSVLDEGQRLVFQGNVDLPVNLEPGTYYLLTRVKSLDPTFQEYTYDDGLLTSVELLDNNDHVSLLQDVEIVRLPQLVVRATDVENERLFYPKETIRFDWELENIGLGDIPSGTELTQTIELWQFDIDETVFSLANGTKMVDVDSVTETLYLPGRLTADHPSQSLIQYRQIFKLPGQADLLAALGATNVAAGMEDMDPAVLAALVELEDYQYFFVITRDQSIEQSSELNLTGVTNGRFRISAFPYGGEDPFLDPITDIDYKSWRSFVASRVENAPSGDLYANFGTSDFANIYYYAFNLPFLSDLSDTSPSLTDDSGTTVYNKTRTVYDEGTEYRGITFPIVRGATDLIYRVQYSRDSGSTWDELLDIQPPYLDTLYGFTAGYAGADSLTGVGGLIDQGNVVSVVDNNYTATVTVRHDNNSAVDMRVVVYVQDQSDLEQFVIDYFESQEEYNYTLMRYGDDYDDDGVSNIVELQLGSDPADDLGTPTPTFLEAFVALGMAEAGVYGSPAPLLISPLDDYDADGVNNALELTSGSNPNDPLDTADTNSREYFVAEQMLRLNAFDFQPVANYAPDDDFDVDGVSNIVELQLGRFPPYDFDAGSTTDLQNFVAERFVYGYTTSVFGFPAPANIGPDDDYDSDGTSNIAEMQLEGDPTSDLDAGTISKIEAYVAEGMAAVGVFGSPAPDNIGPSNNYDTDWVNNALELMLGSDPSDPDSGVPTNTLEYYVAEQLVQTDAFENYPVANFDPVDDLDGDGFSNIAELQLGSDPTDAADVATTSESEAALAEAFAAAGVIVGEFYDGMLVTAADLASDADFDGDGESNLMELALGGDPIADGAQSFALSSQMVGTDFIVTYVRLIVSEQPANLDISAECAPVLTGPWAMVALVGSSEGLNADQSGLPSADYERIDLTIDTTVITCPFLRVSVAELP